LHVAHAAARSGWFPGGVLFATLHGEGLELAQTALDGFLSAMGIPGDRVPADPQARSRLFSSVITRYAEARKPVLVVIDNADSAGQCELLVPAGGRAVITSRNELAILDARILKLPVLSEQAGADLLARQLGVSVGADTRVDDHPDDARAVAALCGGLPLALRIVAAILARNRARPLAAVAKALRDARTRLDELEWEDGGGEVHAVRAAFEVSCHGLQPDRKRVFRLLAANPGPEISAPAAAVLVGLSEPAARRHLDNLAGRHLIEAASDDDRWRMHDLIRIYAAEEKPHDWDDARARLIAYYLNTASAAAEHLAPEAYHPARHTFGGRAQALAWLDSEFPNLAAIAVLPSRGPIFADIALRLWRYFEVSRRTNDGIMLTGHALATVRQLGDRDREAQALSNLAGLFRQARMFEEALAAGQAAAGIYRAASDQGGLGIALNNTTAAQLGAKRFEEALATGREAAAVLRLLGDWHREAIALGHVAIALWATGQLQESIATHQAALEAMREAGDPRGEGAMLSNLGQALSAVGRREEAITVSEQAVAVFEELGDLAGEGFAMNNLGGLLYLQDREREAIPLLRKAADALAEVGDTHSRAESLVNLGRALAGDGRHDEAVTTFTDAASAYRETRDRSGEGTAELGRGQALQAAGRLGEAVGAFRAAAGISAEAGDQRGEATALGLLGSALPDASGEGEEARASLERAVILFNKLGDQELARVLLNQMFPLPTPEEFRAQVKAGKANEVAPGIQIDVVVLGGQHDEEARSKLAEEVRASVRQALASPEQPGAAPAGTAAGPELPPAFRRPGAPHAPGTPPPS
jgi:tetratricopeptide (TPR) repeat protein